MFSIIRFDVSDLQNKFASSNDAKTNDSVSLAQLQSNELGYLYEFGASGVF
jgi:translation elongation factor P/translation initiation factor 5A